MSMIHEAYFLDWNMYYGFFDGPPPSSRSKAAWKQAIPRITEKYAALEKKLSPKSWRSDYLERYCSDRAQWIKHASPDSAESLARIHFLSIALSLSGAAKGYERSWDILNTTLASRWDAQSAAMAVLGVYWVGKEWAFVPDLVSYQFGFVEPDVIQGSLAKLKRLTATQFESAIRSIDWTDRYPVYSTKMDNGPMKDAMRALKYLSSNLKAAKTKQKGLFYLLD